MAGGSVGVSGQVLFGSSYPTPSPGLRENDTYFQTDNGLSNGTVLAEFVWDPTGWVQTVAGGGVSGPQSWTNVSW